MLCSRVSPVSPEFPEYTEIAEVVAQRGRYSQLKETL
jgi:hypothetical protein